MNVYEAASLGLGVIMLVGAIVKHGIAQADKRDRRFEKTIEQLTATMNTGIDKLAAEIKDSFRQLGEVQRDYVPHTVCENRMGRLEKQIEKLEG